MGVRELRETLTHNGAWFMPIVEKYFANMTKGDAPPYPGYLRPSGIDECARMNLYTILGVNEGLPPDPQGMRFMCRGGIDHDTWYDIFKEAGIDVRGGHEHDTRLTHWDPNIKENLFFAA